MSNLPSEPRSPLAITPREVAERLGLSRSAIYELIAKGRLPHVRVGSRILVELAELEEFLALRRVTARQAAERCLGSRLL